MNILLKSDLGAAIGGVLILLVVLALVALWIWALVDAIRVCPTTPTTAPGPS